MNKEQIGKGIKRNAVRAVRTGLAFTAITGVVLGGIGCTEGKTVIIDIPVPGQTDTTDTTDTPEITGLWANTATEAAQSFGTDEYSRNPANWEPTAEGEGWHLEEDGSIHELTLRDFVAEGYWDTKPGTNPQALVANGGNISVQGATVWNIHGERAAQVLWNQKGEYQWPDGTKHTAQAIGFTPNPSAGFNQ